MFHRDGRAASGRTLRGIERLAVFNRMHAALSLRRELPALLDTVAMPARSDCLEIGTGLGWGTVGLLQRESSLSIVVTDREGAILERARGYIDERQPRSRVRYARADARTLPFAEGRFDFVLSLYVLHHTNDYRTSLCEIARVLRPNGLLLMIDLVRPEWSPQLPRIIAPEGLLSESRWVRLFNECGLTVLRWQTRYVIGPVPRCNVIARSAPGRTPIR
jgi:ubiquinone/menaquinone biosynthesis C-methylase UbiE